MLSWRNIVILAYLRERPLLYFRGIAGEISITIMSLSSTSWPLYSALGYSILIGLSGILKDFTDIEWNIILLWDNTSTQDSPFTATSLYSPSQLPDWPIFPSCQIIISELSIRSWISVVLGPFRVFKVLLTCCLAYSFWISDIAFFRAVERYVIVGNGVSYSIIRDKVL
jgi:hypothetical protein